MCACCCALVVRIMDWPGPIYRVAPRMLLKRLRQQHSELREQLELGCEELKEVNSKCTLDVVNGFQLQLSIKSYSTFNAIPN